MPTGYSLSAAPRPACSSGKTKRVSAQLGRLMTASRGSRASSENSRRGVSEDGRGISACSNNNGMSKAAAWMWYTRGFNDAAHADAAGAVVPTVHKQHLATNASGINSSSRKLPAAGATGTQPSRFKQEANPPLASDQAASTALLEAAHDSQHNAEEQPSAKLVKRLLDEFELSRLHELLDRTDIATLHSKLSAQQLAPCLPSAAISYTRLTTSSSRRQIKPLSATLHKLFKIVYNTVHNSSTRNSAMETGRPSRGLSAAGVSKLGSVQHVIYHHHHHYHHYRRSSLDSPARESLYEPTPHRQEFVRRRRHSCSQAQGRINMMGEAEGLVDDLFCSTGDSVHHHPQRSTAAPVISHKLVWPSNASKPRRILSSASLRPVP